MTMPEKQTINQDDIVESFCRMLVNGRWVTKGILPDENRYGIDVLYHKREFGKIMFHFITPDQLEINIEFDMIELKNQGKVYIDSRIELLITQANDAREHRRKQEEIVIYDSSGVPIVPMAKKESTVAGAVKTAVESGETLH